MDHFVVTFYLTACVLTYTIFSIILKFRQRRHFYKLAAKFPGPPTLPIIGNAHLFIGNTEALLNRHFQLGKLYPTPYRLWIGNYLTFVINTPEQFKVVLLSPKAIDKGVFYDFVRPWLGTGLLSAAAAKWRVHRKLMQPTFSPKILQSYVEVFSAQSVIMAEKMKRNLDGPEFDVYNYTSQCTLHTICETTMGVNLGAQTDSNFCYAEAVEKVVGSICRRVVSPWLHPNFIFHLTRLGKDQKKYIKLLHIFTDNVIQTKKKLLLEKNCRADFANSKEDTSNLNGRRKVLLDHLLEVSSDSKILSDEALREEVDTIMVAGSDTTAVTSSYVMLMLASHPEVQEKVYQELCEIYEDDDSKKLNVTPEELTRMIYLERVIKETMRLFPVSPTLTRSLTDDLQIGEHTFPAGSLILLSIIELHRNEDIWPDPWKFNPDRFLPEEVRKRDSYTYLPFSGGPKNCIGSKYAMMSMKTFLATILRRYVLKKDNIVPLKDLRFKWEFLLRPVDPIKLRIQRRTQNIPTV